MALHSFLIVDEYLSNPSYFSKTNLFQLLSGPTETCSQEFFSSSGIKWTFKALILPSPKSINFSFVWSHFLQSKLIGRSINIGLLCNSENWPLTLSLVLEIIFFNHARQFWGVISLVKLHIVSQSHLRQMFCKIGKWCTIFIKRFKD